MSVWFTVDISCQAYSEYTYIVCFPMPTLNGVRWNILWTAHSVSNFWQYLFPIGARIGWVRFNRVRWESALDCVLIEAGSDRVHCSSAHCTELFTNSPYPTPFRARTVSLIGLSTGSDLGSGSWLGSGSGSGSGSILIAEYGQGRARVQFWKNGTRTGRERDENGSGIATRGML